MKSLKKFQTDLNDNNLSKKLKNSILIIMLFLTANIFAQTQELRFNTIEDHTYSEGIGYEYLLANNVRLRDCPSVQCTAITTVKIGTQLKLIKSNDKLEVINGITSHWYKVKLGPDTGWIWGGMIAKNVFKSNSDPNVKFAFGLDRFNEEQYTDQYQIRAYKNGVQIDKIIIKSNTVSTLTAQKIKGDNLNDIISLQALSAESFGNATKPLYVVWEDNKLKKVNRLNAAIKKEKYTNLNPINDCSILPPVTDN